MKRLETKIQIGASPEVVWSILTDFEKYSDWNPFIKKVIGKISEGEELKVTIHDPRGQDLTFKSTVKSVIKNRCCWNIIPYEEQHIGTI